jgi:hypothetical protein
VHDWELEMRVGLGVPVSREVLRAGGDALALQADDEGGDVPCDELGVGPERADPDDRVHRVRVDVGDRSVVEVDPDSGEIGANRRRDRGREGDFVDRAERGVSRV